MTGRERDQRRREIKGRPVGGREDKNLKGREETVKAGGNERQFGFSEMLFLYTREKNSTVSTSVL